MLSRPPYRSLILTAVVTAPLIAIILVTPIILASDLPLRFFWIMTPAITAFISIAWALNIGLLRIRHIWGPYPWLQIPLAAGIMMGVSLLLFYSMSEMLNLHDLATLMSIQNRFTFIRFVNISAVNILIYVLIHMRYLQETRAALASENARLQFNNLETRYQLLKDQINPHFLFNALGTARSLVRRDAQMAEAYIVRLSDFLRASLVEPKDSNTLHEELKLVSDYIALQQMRFQDALLYHCEIDPVAQPARLPFFALLTLVENAIKHNSLTAAAPLRITITRTGDRITVANNRQPKPLPSSGSQIGLRNLAERCQLLGYAAPLVEAGEAQFSVTLSLQPA
jgi:two-component system, LytTR family, sensor kinase